MVVIVGTEWEPVCRLPSVALHVAAHVQREANVASRCLSSRECRD